jgi:succinoglycan biosynthesis protein ExoM
VTVSVCIATFKRPDRLDLLLHDLLRQKRLPEQIVVVDNDAWGSARAIVQCHRATSPPFAIDFEVQPERNIAKTRNRTVALARGDWLAFIDDDERAPEDWLERLIDAASTFAADGVLGPVEPQVPEAAPSWIRRGRFYDFPRMPTGAVVPLNRMRFGNVLLRRAYLRTEQGPFDSRYGLAMGEDGDLLVRLGRNGARIIWCDSAPVSEPIESQRLSLRWLMRRAMHCGQEFGRQTLRGAYGHVGFVGKGRFGLRALLQMGVAFALALVSLPLGRHHAAAWLVKGAANAGKLTAFWGWRHQAYA